MEYIDLDSGMPKVKTEIVKFCELEPGIFYPEEIVISRYNKATSCYNKILTCKVSKAVFNEPIDDGIFGFNFPEGIEVFDMVQKKVWVSSATGGFGQLATDQNGAIIKMSHEDSTDPVSNTLTDPLLKPKQNFIEMYRWHILGALLLAIVVLVNFYIRLYGVLNV